MRDETNKLLFFPTMLAAVSSCCGSCFVVPDVIFRLYYGSPPLSKELYDSSPKLVGPGMTPDQVRTTLGEPHEKYPSNRADEGESWISWADSLRAGYLGVRFDKDGRVVTTWI